MHPVIQHTPSVPQEGVTTMEPWVSLHLSTATITHCPILANSSKSGLLLCIRCSCLHHLSSVPILVTTVCLCAKREIITFTITQNRHFWQPVAFGLLLQQDASQTSGTQQHRLTQIACNVFAVCLCFQERRQLFAKLWESMREMAVGQSDTTSV